MDFGKAKTAEEIKAKLKANADMLKALGPTLDNVVQEAKERDPEKGEFMEKSLTQTGVNLIEKYGEDLFDNEQYEDHSNILIQSPVKSGYAELTEVNNETFRESLNLTQSDEFVYTLPKKAQSPTLTGFVEWLKSRNIIKDFQFNGIDRTLSIIPLEISPTASKNSSQQTSFTSPNNLPPSPPKKQDTLLKTLVNIDPAKIVQASESATVATDAPGTSKDSISYPPPPPPKVLVGRLTESSTKGEELKQKKRPVQEEDSVDTPVDAHKTYVFKTVYGGQRRVYYTGDTCNHCDPATRKTKAAFFKHMLKYHKDNQFRILH